MALPPAIIDEVVRLLAAQDLPQRVIAEVAGVSRGTVNAVATGKRTVAPVVPPEPASEVFAGGSVAQCPGCGIRSRIPPETGDCMACQVRRKGGSATKPGGDESTELALEDSDEVRYQAVLAAVRKRLDKLADSS